MENQNAAYWIEHLSLQPHPEGGFYKEVFRSEMEVT
ncbi:cupin domain-containing protein, partial [uncultured Mucilaginibacter sp.]